MTRTDQLTEPFLVGMQPAVMLFVRTVASTHDANTQQTTTKSYRG
jgi:hypothetical protein